MNSDISLYLVLGFLVFFVVLFFVVYWWPDQKEKAFSLLGEDLGLDADEVHAAMDLEGTKSEDTFSQGWQQGAQIVPGPEPLGYWTPSTTENMSENDLAMKYDQIPRQAPVPFEDRPDNVGLDKKALANRKRRYRSYVRLHEEFGPL